MTLKEFLVSKGAKPASADDIAFLALPLNGGHVKDRFRSYLLWNEGTPNTVYVAEDKLRGLTIVECKDIITNHNNLGTGTKEQFLKTVKELDDLKIEYVLNEERINL